jgi:predicted Zn-dependent protease
MTMNWQRSSRTKWRIICSITARCIEAAKSGKTKVIKATEAEADRLSVWLMANAGYDPEAAISFWERYGKATGPGHFQRAHPLSLADTGRDVARGD